MAHAPATPQHVGAAGVAAPLPASGPAAASQALRFHGPSSSGELCFGSLVLSIPLLNSLFPYAFKNWQLVVYEKTVLFSTITYFFGLLLQ